MKKSAILLIAFLLVLPVALWADSYTQLWKKVDNAAKKDLPRTELTLLQQIADKATAEKAYGQLLKAETQKIQVLSDLSIDSLAPNIQQMEKKAQLLASTDPALEAVYNAVLYKYYAGVRKLSRQYPDKAKLFARRAMVRPELLAAQRALDFEPFVEPGRDSQIFDNDLLSLIGYTVGDYHTLHAYYEKAGNRAAALLTALEIERSAADKNGENRATLLKKSHYAAVLDSLVSLYHDVPACAEVAIERYNLMSGCTDVTAENKVNYINWALNRWGEWKPMVALRNALKELTNPDLTVHLQSTVMTPDASQMLKFTVRNINQLTLTVTKLNVKGDTEYQAINEKDLKQLKRQMASAATATFTRSYTGLPDFKVTADSVQISHLQPGVYLMEATPDDSKVDPVAGIIYVTDLMVICQGMPQDKARVVVVDATTGQPVPGAKVSVQYDKDDVQSLTCDEKGEASVFCRKNRWCSMRATTADDSYMPYVSIASAFRYYNNNNETKKINIYTDRSVYRPGQTVHAAATLYQQQKDSITTLQGQRITLLLRDANYKEVERKQLYTDAYGTVSADFQLPLSCLTGNFTLSATEPVGGVSSRFRVEEYKRPTFEVTLPEVNQRYQAGDTLVITGTAKTYAGVPMQNAAVTYTVRRNPAWWWTWRSFADVDDDDSYFYEGKATTAADGTFKMELPLTLPENMKRQGNGLRKFYNFTAEVAVSDINGETRSAELTVPLGTKPTAFSCTLPQLNLRDSLNSIKFIYKNGAGKDIAAQVTYTIDNQPDRYTAATNQDVPVEWGIAAWLKSGKHKLTAVCEGDTLQQDFIVFSMADKTPCIETHDWFYLSDNTFHADGSPVYLQLGATDQDTHVYYTAIAGNKVIESGTATLSNHLFTREIKYSETFGDALSLNFAWVRDGQLYTHSCAIKKPFPDKKLNLTWTTFRNKLTPGQKEEWTLRVTTPAGKPANAQLMATLYDASLDQIAGFEWPLWLNLWRNVPTTYWDGHNYATFYDHSSQRINWFTEASLKFNTFNLMPETVGYGALLSRNGGKLFYATDAALATGKPMMKGMELSKMNGAASEKVLVGSVSDGELAENEETVDKSQADKGNAKQQSVQLRENLNETAFFYPTLLTDSKGNINMKFTLPESITTWRFMGLAHTQDMSHGKIEATAIASKTVMVQPNMPRFVRAGDHASIAVRISNTSEKAVKGAAVLTLIDPETEKTVAQQKLPFAADASATATVTFTCQPDASHSLLVCKVVAEGKGFSDGEQHYLPVLPDQELVVNTQPVTLHEKGSQTIQLDSLFAAKGDRKRLTIEYTDNPAWLLVQALPYMGTANDDNIVSLSTAYYANSLSAWILKQMPNAKTVFEQWRREGQTETGSLVSALSKNQELKNLVLEETPWLADANTEATQKQALANYFDNAALQNSLTSLVSRMQRLQNNDGSWSWWKGMKGSPRLTSEVAVQLARLDHLTGQQSATLNMKNKAVSYLGGKANEEVKEIKKHMAEKQPYTINDHYALQYLYIRTLNGDKLSAADEATAKFLLDYLKKNDRQNSLFAKALMAVVLAKRGDMTLAKQYVQSLEEYTVATKEQGRYYDTHRAGYSWTDYRIPTQAAAMEAMQLIGAKEYAQQITEMKRWLLQQKRTQGWNTPVNSVNAVYAFFNGNDQMLSTQPMATMTLDGKALELPQATAGLGYVKTTAQPEKAHQLVIDKQSEGTSWGAVYAQSLVKTADIAASEAGLSVKREVLAADGKAATALKVGDKVKVRITVRADRDYDFVQINDKRAACMEPVSQLSGYRMGYYCTPKDNATCYYFDMLSKGEHVIETEYYVDRAGSYDTGSCTVQCAYAPEYAARAASQTLDVK